MNRSSPCAVLITAGMDIIMVDETSSLALLRLMTWLSPAFPIGSFAYSGGLERAVEDHYVHDAASLEQWVTALISHGSMWTDAIFCAEAHRLAGANPAGLVELAELAEALAGSRERHQELTLLGSAFLQASKAWSHEALENLPADSAYPVAVGAVAGVHGIGLESSVAAFLNAAVSQLCSVAIRCGVVGQVQAVGLIAQMEDVIIEVAQRAATSNLNDLGSATVLADISSLRHEVQGTRLFRS